MDFRHTEEKIGFAKALSELLSRADTPAVARSWAEGDKEPGLALWNRLAEQGVCALIVIGDEAVPATRIRNLASSQMPSVRMMRSPAFAWPAASVNAATLETGKSVAEAVNATEPRTRKRKRSLPMEIFETANPEPIGIQALPFSNLNQANKLVIG